MTRQFYTVVCVICFALLELLWFYDSQLSRKPLLVLLINNRGVDYNTFETETGWNDFALRNYDAQTGRFIQADPYDQFPSPYTGMGNDPVNNVDPNGGFYFGINWLGISNGLMSNAQVILSRAINTVVFAGVGYAVDKLSGGNGLTGAYIGGGAGLGATFVNWSTVGKALGNSGSWVGDGFSNSNILNNVALYIAIAGEEYASQFNNKNQDGWHIIVKNNLKDANEALQKYHGKKSLNNILLETHGTKSGNEIVYDGESMGVITQKKLEEFTAEGKRYPSIVSLQNIGNSLNVGGNLVITACNLAKQGTSTLEEISKL